MSSAVKLTFGARGTPVTSAGFLAHVTLTVPVPVPPLVLVTSYSKLVVPSPLKAGVYVIVLPEKSAVPIPGPSPIIPLILRSPPHGSVAVSRISMFCGSVQGQSIVMVVASTSTGDAVLQITVIVPVPTALVLLSTSYSNSI